MYISRRVFAESLYPDWPFNNRNNAEVTIPQTQRLIHTYSKGQRTYAHAGFYIDAKHRAFTQHAYHAYIARRG